MLKPKFLFNSFLSCVPLFAVVALALSSAGCGSKQGSASAVTWIQEAKHASGEKIRIGYMGEAPKCDTRMQLVVEVTRDGKAIEDAEVSWTKGEPPKRETKPGQIELPVVTGAGFGLEFSPSENDEPGIYVVKDTAPLRVDLRQLLDDKKFSSNGKLPVVIQIEPGPNFKGVFRKTFYFDVVD